jgi:F-type H+-transporting ATPase subunit alpha
MEQVLIPQIAADFQKQIAAFSFDIQSQDVGTVVEAGDGIAHVSGLADVRNAELVEFENGVLGIVFNLEKDNVV